MYSYKYKNGYLIYNRESNKVSFTEELVDTDENEIIDNNIDKNKVKLKTKNNYNTKEIQITYFSTPFCNLSCKYCYEHGKIQNFNMSTMSSEQYFEIYKAMEEHFPKSKIKICFFGGEPFLAKQPITNFIKNLQCTCDQSDTEFPSLVAITNGTLLDDDSVKLVYDYFDGVTFSLDGTKVLHNANRVYKDGRGSYDDVISNIKRLNELNIDKKIKTSCEVTLTDAYFTNYSRELMREVLMLLKELEFNTVEFITVMDDNSKYINKIENLDMIAKDLVDFWYDDIIYNSKTVYIPTLMSYLFLLIGNKTVESTTCAAGHSYFAIDSNYNVYPCQVSTFEDGSVIGNIYNGNFKLNDSQEDLYAEKNEHPLCKECECLKGCNRYCKVIMNNMGEEVPISCLFSKQLFKHSLIKIVELMNSKERNKFVESVKALVSKKDNMND